MPEFAPQHTPDGLDDFTTGYMVAAEWLLDEGDRKRRIRGWSRDAVEKAKANCAKFQADNADNLEKYYELRGPTSHGYSAEECAGHDFWLTRTGSGTGFRDRGDDPVFIALDEAAHNWRTVDVYRGDSGWLHFA